MPQRFWPGFSQAFIALSLLAGMEYAAAAQSYLPKLGGPGGGAFDVRCPIDRVLYGFELHTGDDVDAIRPICIRMRGPAEIDNGTPAVASGGAFKFGWTPPTFYGGARGVYNSVVCPLRTPVVLGIAVESEGADTVVVNSIALFCGLAAPSQPVSDYPNAIFEGPRYQRSQPWMGIGVGGAPSFPDTQQQACPPGQVAIGIHGRTGLWVDAIGLICGAPRVSAPPAPPKVTVGSIGRVSTTGPSPAPAGSICDAARSARARNSPAAPNLEAQCRAQGPTVVRSIGRVGPAGPPAPRPPICDAAAASRARNSPAAPNLEAQCRAAQAANPPPPAEPAPPPAEEPPPEPAPEPPPQ